MKRTITALLLLGAAMLWSQEGLVLQRVYIPAPRIDAEDSVAPIFFEAGETLFALINLEQPLIRSGSEAATSTIETVIASVPGGTEIAFFLVQDGERVAESVEVIPEQGRYPAYQEFLQSSAESFVPLLERVEPDVRVKELAADEETREVLNAILFAEAMATPFEATMWIGLASKNLGGDDGPPLYLHAPFHYFSELAWFPAPNHGISATLLLEYSNLISYGRDAFDNDGGDSDNLYILPGIGYTYRTLGRLSGGFFTGLNLGWARITANEDLYDEGTLKMSSGESEWALTHHMVIKPFVSYSLNESWSLKTSFALYLSIFDMFNLPLSTGVASGYGGGYLQFLNLGIGYRW